MNRIYLAGKMADEQRCECDCDRSSTDERHFLLPPHDARCSWFDVVRTHWRDDLGVRQAREGRDTSLAGGFVFGGPWFIDWSQHETDRHHVPLRCFEWIRRSDGVFVWLTTPDAHGTLIEAGFAKAIGKPLFLVVDTSSGVDLRRELWFAEHTADGFAALPSLRDAWTVFTHWWRAGRSKDVSPYGIRFR